MSKSSLEGLTCQTGTHPRILEFQLSETDLDPLRVIELADAHRLPNNTGITYSLSAAATIAMQIHIANTVIQSVAANSAVRDVRPLIEKPNTRRRYGSQEVIFKGDGRTIIVPGFTQNELDETSHSARMPTLYEFVTDTFRGIVAVHAPLRDKTKSIDRAMLNTDGLRTIATELGYDQTACIWIPTQAGLERAMKSRNGVSRFLTHNPYSAIITLTNPTEQLKRTIDALSSLLEERVDPAFNIRNPARYRALVDSSPEMFVNPEAARGVLSATVDKIQCTHAALVELALREREQIEAEKKKNPYCAYLNRVLKVGPSIAKTVCNKLRHISRDAKDLPENIQITYLRRMLSLLPQPDATNIDTLASIHGTRVFPEMHLTSIVEQIHYARTGKLALSQPVSAEIIDDGLKRYERSLHIPQIDPREWR